MVAVGSLERLALGCSLGSQGLTGSGRPLCTRLPWGWGYECTRGSCLIWKKLGQGKEESGYGEVRTVELEGVNRAVARMLRFCGGASSQKSSWRICCGNQRHVTQGMGKTGCLEPGEHCRGHESCLWTNTGLSYGWGVKLVL